MTTIESLRQSFKCDACGQWLMAPERSTYLNEKEATHLWVCPKCGNKFETSISIGPEVPLAPEITSTFLSSLLVA
jgi:transcription elongation factor Elf1